MLEVVELLIEDVFEVVTIDVEAVVMMGIGELTRVVTWRLQEDCVITYCDQSHPVQFQVNSSTW